MNSKIKTLRYDLKSIRNKINLLSDDFDEIQHQLEKHFSDLDGDRILCKVKEDLQLDFFYSYEVLEFPESDIDMGIKAYDKYYNFVSRTDLECGYYNETLTKMVEH